MTALATVGARLREAREMAGLSEGQAAKLLGITATQVQLHETDWMACDELTLARYARAYGVAVSALRNGVPAATVDDLGFGDDAYGRAQRATFERLPESDRAAVLGFAQWLQAPKRKDRP